MSRGVTRRTFFKRSAGAAAGVGLGLALPAIIPGRALGADDTVAASERIRVGMIGVGGMGSGHLGGLVGNRQVEVVAVCDVDQGHREDARARVGEKCAAYNDFRELLDRQDIDAVWIATPDHWHTLTSISACQAGKDIYCEKALAISVAEGRAMCDAVRRYGRVFQHGTQQRSDANFRLACELVRNGRIGRLRTITASVPASEAGPLRQPAAVPRELDYDLWLGPSPWIPHCGQAGIGHPGWCFRSDYSPGFILTWGVHHLDIAQWGNGTEAGGPVEFVGRGVFPRRSYDDAALTWHVECTYANGVRLVFTSENENPNGVRFEGDEGWVFVTRGGIDAGPKSLLRSPIGPDEVRLYRSSDHAGNFLECVRSRAATVAPIEVAHRSTTIGLVSSLAVLLGRKLRWDPQGEVFVDDDEANRMLTRAMRSPWRV